MDSLLELIDSRINKALAKSDCVNSQIGQVVSVSGSTCEVKLFTTGAVYTIPNYSGSDIRKDQMVYVYWKGGFLSNQNAYIGAALTTGGSTLYMPCQKTLVSLIETDQRIVKSTFKAQGSTYVTLYFNALIETETSDDVNFTIIIDGVESAYTPKQTTIIGYNHCSFTMYIPLETIGEHEIEIKANGTGDIIQIESFITGQEIREE